VAPVGVPITVELSLAAADRFVATVVPVSEVVARVFDTVEHTHDAQAHLWSFPVAVYSVLVADLSTIPSVRVIGLPQAVVSLFVEGRRPAAVP
jgi:hypothetical protein